mmetsp:Transcript_6707/g.14504  ORF Transcript_6707/g.14504 Transcript_6707/m.14504 type:complete len:124 (-) Transcript_6707:41-412(-)
MKTESYFVMDKVAESVAVFSDESGRAFVGRFYHFFADWGRSTRRFDQLLCQAIRDCSLHSTILLPIQRKLLLDLGTCWFELRSIYIHEHGLYILQTDWMVCSILMMIGRVLNKTLPRESGILF